MSRGKNRLLNEKYAILGLMRDPYFLAGQAASGGPGEPALGALAVRLAEIDAELERRAKA